MKNTTLIFIFLSTTLLLSKSASAQVAGSPPPPITSSFSELEIRGISKNDTLLSQPKKCFVLDIDTSVVKNITPEVISEAMRKNKYRQVDCTEIKKKN